jgi:hypothetical protein
MLCSQRALSRVGFPLLHKENLPTLIAMSLKRVEAGSLTLIARESSWCMK